MSDENSTIQKRKNWIWLMAAFSWDPLVSPNVGAEDNLGGFSYIIRANWHNQVVLFSAHSTRGFFQGDPIEEHRYDYSFLYGFAKRNPSSFFDAGVGLSIVDYIKHGNVITPPSSQNALDGTYQQLSGTAYGPAAMVSYYRTLSIYEGAGYGAGIGLYGSLAKGVSYFALEFTLIELNIPIPIQ
jgi:hypothetical protein